MPTFIREKSWRCSSCGTRVKGRHKECQHCGQPKGREKFEALPGAGKVTDPEMLKQANAGRDWECKYCRSHQRRDNGQCEQCGSDQSDSLEDKKRRRQVAKQALKEWEDERGVKWVQREDGTGTAVPNWLVDAMKERDWATLPEIADAAERQIEDEKIDERIEAVEGEGYRGRKRQDTPEEDSAPPVELGPTDDLRSFTLTQVVPRPWHRRWWSRQRKLTAGIMFGVTLLGLLCFILFRTRIVDAEVTALAWAHTVKVERKEVHTGEGFDEDIPSGAFAKKSHGTRHHHDEPDYECGRTPKVCRTEKGSCRTTPVSCTDLGNGYERCSGGDEVCEPDREVCRGDDPIMCKGDPVYETWYSWRVWKWTHNRAVVAKGTTDKPYWPTEDEIALGVGLSTEVENGQSEEERANRSTNYEVTFTDTDRETHSYTPKGLDEFMVLRPGTKRRIQVGILRSTKILGVRQ